MNSCLFAYLDPGTGAIILQLVLAGLLTMGVLFRRVFRLPLSLFKRFRKEPTSEPGAERDSTKDSQSMES